jgi:hypothetical protein
MLQPQVEMLYTSIGPLGCGDGTQYSAIDVDCGVTLRGQSNAEGLGKYAFQAATVIDNGQAGTNDSFGSAVKDPEKQRH